MMFRCVAALSILLVASGSFAQSDVAGKWVGKLYLFHPTDKKIKPVPLPAPEGNVVYTLTLKSNGTYMTSIAGTPDKKTHTTEGTWKKTASGAVLSVLKRDGVPDQSEPRVRTLSRSADGKSLITEMKGTVEVKGPKGEKQMPKGVVLPKVMLVFVRAK